MKKIIFVFVLIAGILAACQKKGMPAITERKTDPPPPAKKASDIKPDMAIGKVIFINRCGRCHDLPKPEQYTAKRWEGILSSMIPNARLNDEQGVHIAAYLKSNAQK